MTMGNEIIVGLLGTLISAIAAMAGYFAWQNKLIVKAYFEHQPQQTEAMQTIAATVKDVSNRLIEHDQRSAKAADVTCNTMADIAASVRAITVNQNGTARKKRGEPK